MRKKPKTKKPFDRDKWLVGQLRRLTLRFPPAIEAINRAKETYYITSKSGKLLKRVKFTCEGCGKKDLKRTQVDLDHTIPVVGKEGFINISIFIDRLLCGSDNLKILCIDPCHLNKSKNEMEERIAYKKSLGEDVSKETKKLEKIKKGKVSS